MPRSSSPALLAHFQSGATTAARLVLIVRSDGFRIGLTSTDIPVTYGPDTYEPFDAGAITALHQKASEGIDNAEFAGILSSTRITDTDLIGGLYDGAAVTLYVVNYEDLTMGSMILASGYLGQVVIFNDEYQAEFRATSQLIRQYTGESTSPTCRVALLGDNRCKVNLSGNTADGHPILVSSSVSTVTDPLDLVFNGVATPSNYYVAGILKFTSGANAGISREIKSHTNSSGNAVLSLRQSFPFAVAVGDTAQLQIGCDRNPATCQARFANIINFRGEKDLPGNTQITQVGYAQSTS